MFERLVSPKSHLPIFHERKQDSLRLGTMYVPVRRPSRHSSINTADDIHVPRALPLSEPGKSHFSPMG